MTHLDFHPSNMFYTYLHFSNVRVDIVGRNWKENQPRSVPDLGITTNSLQQTSQFDLDSFSPHSHHFLEDFKYAELSWSRGHSKVNQVGIATRSSQKWEVVNWAESLLHLQNVVRLWSRQKSMLQNRRESWWKKLPKTHWIRLDFKSKSTTEVWRLEQCRNSYPLHSRDWTALWFVISNEV